MAKLDSLKVVILWLSRHKFEWQVVDSDRKVLRLGREACYQAAHSEARGALRKLLGCQDTPGPK